MPWAAFATRAQWTTFHDAVCADLGIPRPGRRQSDQAPAIRNQWTTAQFEPHVVDVIVNGNPRKIGLCQVPQQAVTRYSLNTVTDPEPVVDAQGKRTGTWTVTYNGRQYTVALAPNETAFPFRKTKPATYAMDGVTYNTSTGLPV